MPDMIEQQKYTLYEMRKLSGVPPTTVTRQIGATYQSLRNWERGDTVPSVVYVYALLEVYGFTHDQLDIQQFIDKIVKKQPSDALIYTTE